MRNTEIYVDIYKIKKLEERISELEKIWKTQQDSIEKSWDRLTELEAKIISSNLSINTFNNRLNEIDKYCVRETTINNERIAELRIQIQNNSVVDLNHYEILLSQLNELKEEQEKRTKHLHDEIHELEEHWTRQQEEIDFCLRKLDGKKERIYGTTTSGFVVKDSGGDVSEFVNCDIESVPPKPPEPIRERKCSFCGKMFKNHNISHYGNFICKPEEDEPRENDYNHFKRFFWTKAKKELISEFVEDLKGLPYDSSIEIYLHELVLKWEGGEK